LNCETDLSAQSTVGVMTKVTPPVPYMALWYAEGKTLPPFWPRITKIFTEVLLEKSRQMLR